MKKIIIFTLLFAAVLISCSTNNHVYYISSSGDDASAGTSPEKAWKSIAKVNETTFAPGDKILLQDGETFEGGLVFEMDDTGTPENPVTISSYGEGRATISSGNEHGFFATNTSGIVIEDLNFVGGGVDIDEQFSGILFFTDLDTVKPEFIRIDNVEVSGYRWEGISFQGERQKGSSGFRDVKITNAEVHDNGDKGIAVGGPQPEGEWGNKDFYIGNCKVYNIRGILGRRSHSGNGIIVSSLDGGLIEYCVAYNNGENSDSPHSGGPIGIWAWDSRNVVFQFNEAYENKTGNRADGGGFDLDGGCVNCIMQYNYSHDNHGAGFGIYQYRGAREFKGNIIRYNISENDGTTNKHGGINLWATNSSGGMQDTKIYNNTIYISDVTRGAGIEDFPDEEGQCFIYNTEIYNNIFVGTPGKSLVKIPNPGDEWIFNGNCYYTYGGPIEIDWGDRTFQTLDAWRASTGQEKQDGQLYGIETDPYLTDPGNGGIIGIATELNSLTAYKLKESSDLIDNGLDIRSVFGVDPGNQDFYGVAIPVNEMFDIGASEYDSPSSD